MKVHLVNITLLTDDMYVYYTSMNCQLWWSSTTKNCVLTRKARKEIEYLEDTKIQTKNKKIGQENR